MLKYRIPLQGSMNDIFYVESEEHAKFSKVSLQFRIDTFLKAHDIDPKEQYPHMKNNYKSEVKHE